MKYYLSFDVESIGLFGPPFAFGYVVVDEKGEEYESGIYGWDFRSHPLTEAYENYSTSRWDITEDNLEWVEKNVLPTLPDGWVTCSGLKEFCSQVYSKVWSRCKRDHEDLTFVSDCPVPVEANFVETMLKIVGRRDMMASPYPLIDVASVLLGRGYDPLKEYERKENEQPSHNPENDARQSVRIMIEAINGNLAFKKRAWVFQSGLLSVVRSPVGTRISTRQQGSLLVQVHEL